MALGYLLVAVLAAAVAVFALQNNEPATVRFLVWTLPGLPLAGLVLLAFGLGLVIAGLPLWLRSWRWRAKARSLESRVAGLERALADRDQALLRRSPPGALPAAAPPGPSPAAPEAPGPRPPGPSASVTAPRPSESPPPAPPTTKPPTGY